jgi:hypothetical protein
MGLTHTDLNPGNFGFRIVGGDVALVLYDFGSSQQLLPEAGVTIYRWIEATKNADAARALDCLVSLGFDSRKLSHINAKILPLSQVVLAPFLETGPWTASTWNLQEKIDAVLGADKWWFRTAGPPWFLYFMRTIQGWHQAMLVLDATISIEDLWWPWKQQLESVSRFYGARENPPSPEPAATDAPALRSTHLRVLVTEGSEEVVDLTLPARAVEDLEDLVPAGVATVCSEQGINLREIGRETIASGGIPRQLFSANHGKRTYKVWLE